MRNDAEALIIRRIRMIMKDLRIQAKKRPGLDFCDFRLERNSNEKPTFAQKPASYANFVTSERAKLKRELLCDEKQPSRLTFARQKPSKSKRRKIKRET